MYSKPIFCIFKTFLLFISGVNIEERIDIHTQTQRKSHSANPYLPVSPNGNEDHENGENGEELDEENEENGLYKKDLDMEWKTQSLPSLGRVSSEQTLESSGDEFAALRRAAPTRMLKSRNVSFLFCFFMQKSDLKILQE